MTTKEAKDASEGCFTCDWRDSRQHIGAELERMSRSTEAIHEQLRELGKSLEDREQRWLSEIQRLDEKYIELVLSLQKQVQKNEIDIAGLKVRAGIIGAVAGSLALVGMVLWELLRGHVIKGGGQ